MKIYILRPSDEVRPLHGFRAPAHNADWGVEQGFFDWLIKLPYITQDPAEADWDYLPIWFNRFYTAHWGSDESVAVLQNEILRLVSRNRPTFTIVEYGIKTLQPSLDLCNMTIFTAGRMVEDDPSIDIPLLCSLHAPTPEPVVRQWRASFMGKFETNAYREKMRDELAGRDDVFLSAGVGTEAYAKLLANSEITLAPRGFTGASFRYEAMQFASVPFLIGDIDTRPFKQWIDWDAFSLYTNDPAQIPAMIDELTVEDTRRMGEVARVMFFNQLYYGRWEQYVIKHLETL